MRRRLVELLLFTVTLLTEAAHAQVLPPPAIGGSPASFEQLIGGPNDASIGAILHYQRCAGTDVDQFVLLAPNDQVWTIQRQWCQRIPPPVDQRLADAVQFLPADAIAGAPFTTDLGETALSYQSSMLGSTLPAGLFHDCMGNPATPGTLFVVADAYGGWFMGPGLCPSQ